MTTSDQRDNVLKAAACLVEELKKVGPLILIVDDVQWADEDTQSALDFLQVNGGEMLGIITVSRHVSSLQRCLPDAVLKLKPLSDKEAVKMLSDAAKRASVSISRAAIQELCEAAGGNPFRLSELANEFRAGGILHILPDPSDSSVSNIGNLDRLWAIRVARLSSDARRLLPYIATASDSVSINQLAMLDKGNEHIEIAVSELVNQRLVSDDATGGECIDMIHDRICEGVIAGFSKAERLQANLAWADLLRSYQEEGNLYRRIARHLLNANKLDEALPFAKRAGEYSEQSFSYSEAADWHHQVCEIYQQTSDADSKQTQYDYSLRAAECLVKAAQPVLAARRFRHLADSTTEPLLKRQHNMTAVELLVRSGRYDQVSELLNSLCDSLDLPKIDQPSCQQATATPSHRSSPTI